MWFLANHTPWSRASSFLAFRQADADGHTPSFKPYWGKPAVRNFRGGAGTVTMGAGLRPTPEGVHSPPDPPVPAPALHPMNCRASNADLGIPRHSFAVESAAFHWQRKSK